MSVTEIDRSPSALSVLRRRVDGTQQIDEWGLDDDLIRLISPAVGLRWSVEGQFTERLPATEAAVLVHNRGLSEAVVLARGVREATGRHVRTVGLLDVPPFATVARAVGAVADRPDELRGLLRAGHLVGLPLGRDLRPGARAGGLDPAALRPALDTGALVIPVALIGRAIDRSWRLLVGHPIDHPPGKGPLAVAELVDAARAGVQGLIDEAGTRWF